MQKQNNVVAGTTETPAHVVARREYVQSIGTEYGALVNYAKSLETRWPETEGLTAWYAVQHTEVNEYAKSVLGERDAFYAECESAGVKSGTARKRWKAVRDYGKILREGEPEKSDSGNNERPLAQANPEILLALYKRNARAEKRDAKSATTMKAIAELLQETWKINLDNI